MSLKQLQRKFGADTISSVPRFLIGIIIALYLLGFVNANSAGTFGPVLKIAVQHSHQHSHDVGSDHDSSHHDDAQSSEDTHDGEVVHSHSLVFSGFAASTSAQVYRNDNLTPIQQMKFFISNDRLPKAPALSGLLRPPISA